MRMFSNGKHNTNDAPEMDAMNTQYNPFERRGTAIPQLKETHETIVNNMMVCTTKTIPFFDIDGRKQAGLVATRNEAS